MENSKPLALVLFFSAFVGIILYVYTGKKRKQRLESYKDIPFMDDDELDPTHEKKQQVKKDESNGK
ncbi:CcoQ/FixQ family Cbb3-type cytochrome c oxidase assembly chaperone [Guyparkeria halophila]|uniref:CcoQ/FixQ family Cbb3-type cytochrome c oxidase assembly chaperone n=1 Tax=Guyparkeria halophila TaxID=47960 RepID=A0A6I6CTM0_9GAMM|nr:MULTISPECIES: cbb3-type cytochrome c oxidase subunit 3 [Guyparkeria]QGT77806.1 CcoQ/FixQ family Cbb3-type cytochrome c oxidase assembly chaperone [Guyparkeria halophila]TKA88412.1 cbb3-type cytochrome c oxidase subunit 3 [Guyparkeria sp. SB14A]